MADDEVTRAHRQKEIDKAGFGGSFTDMGHKHATGMGHTYHAHPEYDQSKGFFGTVTDMGTKHVKGMDKTLAKQGLR